MNQPQVDILLATYNGERYLAEQLDSIIGQTYQNWRLLVNDDGSADGTIDIIRRYGERDSRICLLDLENTVGSAAGNFMALLGYSGSDYVMFCDQDDVWNSDKVGLELTHMLATEKEEGREKPIVVFTDSKIVDENLEDIGGTFSSRAVHDPRQTSLPQLLVDNVAPGCTMMINRPLANLTKRLPMPECVGMHDYWAILLAAALGKVVFVDEVAMQYRQHAGNVIGAPGSRGGSAHAGVLHILRDPRFFREWLSNVRSDAKTFAMRSEMLYRQIADRVPDSTKDVLLRLNTFYERGKLARLKDVFRFRLLKGQRNLYSRATQLVGMLSIPPKRI